MLADNAMQMKTENQGNMPVLQTATAVATSFLICRAATYLTKLYGIQGGTLPGVTAIIVILATFLPKFISPLVPVGHTVALVLMQVTQTLLFQLCKFSFWSRSVSFVSNIMNHIVKQKTFFYLVV